MSRVLVVDDDVVLADLADRIDRGGARMDARRIEMGGVFQNLQDHLALSRDAHAGTPQSFFRGGFGSANHGPLMGQLTASCKGSARVLPVLTRPTPNFREGNPSPSSAVGSAEEVLSLVPQPHVRGRVGARACRTSGGCR